MLILSRKRDQHIVITDPTTGTRVSIAVVEIRGDKVRIGIIGPREWEVHRGEVQDVIDIERGEKPTPRNFYCRTCGSVFLQNRGVCKNCNGIVVPQEVIQP